MEINIRDTEWEKNCKTYVFLTSCPKAYKIQKDKEVYIVESYFDIMREDSSSTLPSVFEMNRISSLQSMSDVQHKGTIFKHVYINKFIIK